MSPEPHSGVWRPKTIALSVVFALVATSLVLASHPRWNTSVRTVWWHWTHSKSVRMHDYTVTIPANGLPLAMQEPLLVLRMTDDRSATQATVGRDTRVPYEYRVLQCLGTMQDLRMMSSEVHPARTQTSRGVCIEARSAVRGQLAWTDCEFEDGVQVYSVGGADSPQALYSLLD